MPEAVERFREVLGRTPRGQPFGNGRFARNALEAAIGHHAWRLRETASPTLDQLRQLVARDFDEEPLDEGARSTGRVRSGGTGAHGPGDHPDPGGTDVTQPRAPAAGPRGTHPPAGVRPAPSARSPFSGPTPGHQPSAGAHPRRPRPGSRPSRSSSPCARLGGHPGAAAGSGHVSVAAALLFGLAAGYSFRSADGALARAAANTDQLVRIQAIQTNVVQADADATNAFLVGGLEPAAQRADYTEAIAAASKLIAEAAQHQPADGTPWVRSTRRWSATRARSSRPGRTTARPCRSGRST